MPKFKKGMQVVVIDDNAGEAKLLLYALKSRGLEHVVHFDNGIDALHWLFAEDPYTYRETDKNPRLILLDINMSGMSGIDVLKSIRSREHTATIPVVMLTSSSEDSDLNQAYSNGANGYVLKPIVFEDFNAVVDRLNSFWTDTNIPPVGSS